MKTSKKNKLQPNKTETEFRQRYRKHFEDIFDLGPAHPACMLLVLNLMYLDPKNTVLLKIDPVQDGRMLNRLTTKIGEVIDHGSASELRALEILCDKLTGRKR